MTWREVLERPRLSPRAPPDMPTAVDGRQGEVASLGSGGRVLLAVLLVVSSQHEFFVRTAPLKFGMIDRLALARRTYRTLDERHGALYRVLYDLFRRDRRSSLQQPPEGVSILLPEL